MSQEIIPMSINKNKQVKIEAKIEVLRNELIETGELYGYLHPKTIKISQQLDNIINEYQLMKLHLTR